MTEASRNATLGQRDTRILLALRAGLFFAGQAIATIVLAGPAMATVLLPLSWRYRLVPLWARFNVWWLRITCGLRYEVAGREHLPDRPAVFLAKHQSAWETLAFPQVLPLFAFVLKRELLWIPLFGWSLAVLRPIAIDRAAGPRAIREMLSQGRSHLEHGRSVLIFPEGTRVAPGERRRYQQGGAMLATRTGCPVVPIAHDAGRFWPRRSWFKQPGTVRVAIGPAIETEGRTAAEVTAEAEAWIEGRMADLQGE